MIALESAARPPAAVAALKESARVLGNVAGAGGMPIDRLNGWRAWASSAAETFRGLLSSEVVKDRILGSRHTLLQTLDPAAYGSGLHVLVDAEITFRLQELEALAKDINVEWIDWGAGKTVVMVLDTNILVAFGHGLLTVDWHLKINKFYETPIVLTVPIQVVEELDVLKDRGDKDSKPRARAALRWLDEIFPQGRRRHEVAAAPFRGFRQLEMRLLLDELDRTPLPRADADILDRTLAIAPYTESAFMVSNDYSMRFRAEALGLGAVFVQRSDLSNPNADGVQ